MKLIAASAHSTGAEGAKVIELANTEDPRTLDLTGVTRIDLNFPKFTDRDAFVAIFEAMGCQPGVYDIHHATNWEIELTGADRATGKWSLNFRTILTGPRQVVRLAVEYQDVYTRQDGRWWISESVSRVTSMLTEQVGEDGSVTVVALAEAPAEPEIGRAHV